MRRAVVQAAFTIAAVALLAVTASAQGQIVVCGTGDSQELLRRLGAAFEKTASGVTVEVPDSIGSTGGIKAAAAGECAFGRVARPLKESERELGLTYRVFAFSPVVVVVDPAAGVQDLKAGQIVGIFSGKITDWSAVGGATSPISVVNREPKDSSRSVLNARLAGFKAVENPVGVVATKTPAAVELISSTANVIGYLPMAMTKGLDRTIVRIDGVEPTAVNVVQNRYDIVSPFGLVWKGEPRGGAASFLNFLKSEAAKKIIIDYGIVPAEML